MKRCTCVSLAEEYLRYIRLVRNLSAHTQRAYAADLAQFLTFWEAYEIKKNSRFIFKQVVDPYFLMLFEERSDKSTIARKVSCLRSFLKFAKDEHKITVPIRLSRPRLDKKLPTYLSVEEITRLLDTTTPEMCKGSFPYRDLAIIDLLYSTGIRCAELVAIRMMHINMREQTIIIRGKGRRERMVLFGEPCKKKLLYYIEKERPQSKYATDYLFVNYRHLPLSTRAIQYICNNFQPFLGPNRILTPHVLRHSFATHFINNDGDLCTLQRLLGHSSLTSTEWYTHVSLERLTKLCNERHPLLTLEGSSSDT